MINSNLFKQSGKKSGETPEVRCDKKKPREETKDTEEIEETEETDIEEVEEMLKKWVLDTVAQYHYKSSCWS